MAVGGNSHSPKRELSLSLTHTLCNYLCGSLLFGLEFTVTGGGVTVNQRTATLVSSLSSFFSRCSVMTDREVKNSFFGGWLFSLAEDRRP